MKFARELLELDYLIFSSNKSATQTIVETLNEHGFRCKIEPCVGDDDQFRFNDSVRNNKKTRFS